MSRMYYKNLMIMSRAKGIAAKFDFSESYNLILSNQKNNVGKSSLVKNIFWCFGCEPYFDDRWKSLDCEVALDFRIDDKIFCIHRYKNIITLIDDIGVSHKYTAIGGDFSNYLLELLNFDAKLKVRDEKHLITPPPAFYFLPFYIDQKKGWSNLWASFDKLQQFSDWKKTIVETHAGILDKQYFAITEEMLDGEIRIDKTNKEIERYDTAISVINEGVELAGLSFDIDDIDVLQHEINNDLEPLCLKKEIIIEELSALRKDKAHISSRLKIAKGYYSEVNEDYEYAQSLSNEIECPTCGASYNNSVVEKFTLYQDADQLLSLIKRFDKEFSEIVDLIAEKNLELNNLSYELEKLNDKYSSKIVDDIEPGTALSLLASKFSSNRIDNNRKQKVDVIDKVLRKNKELKAERLINVKLKRKQVKDRFQLRFGDFSFKLKSFGVDSSSVPSILSYNKVPNSGGAAESIRAMLAYYISVYNIVDEFSDEVLAPLVIDTPNQHEQANNHYDNIVGFLMTELPKDSQLFLCSMDDVKLDPLKRIGNVIYLEDERSLLKKDSYELVSAFIALKIHL